MSACGISYPTGRICFCKIKWSSISRPLLYLWYKAAVLIINIFIAFQQFFHHRSRHWVALRGHALNGEKKAAQASCRKSWGFKANSQRFRIWYPMDCRESWWEPMALEPGCLRIPKAPSLQTATLGNRWVLPKKEKTGKHWRVGQTCWRSTTFYSWSYMNMPVQTNQESWHPSFEDVKKMFQTVGTFRSGLHWKSETI